MTKDGKQVWKTSFRYYVPVFSIDFQYIHTILEIHDDSFFDRQVYKPKEQMYVCIFNAKDREGGNKILEPITSHSTEDFIVQVVREDNIFINGKGIKAEYDEQKRQAAELDSASILSGASTISLLSSVGSERDISINYEDFMQVVIGLAPKRADSREDWVGNIKGIKYAAQSLYHGADPYIGRLIQQAHAREV
jgi:hypothetical protein